MFPTMTVRIPDDLQKELAELAKKQGFTRNGLVLKILWDWVEHQETKETDAS
jgi:predicted transcriptional regulator